MIPVMSPALEIHLRVLPSRALTFEAGQFLFHLGDPVRLMHVVRSGMVRLTRHQRDGTAVVLRGSGPGSILAEASLYAEAYHCDAVAASATRVLVSARADFHAHLRRTPAFAEAWASHLAHELQHSRTRAEILSLKTVAARLDAWIVWRDGLVPAKGEWRALAGELGVSPEALYREMARRRTGAVEPLASRAAGL